MKVVSFSGADSLGKSMYSELIKKEVENSGKKAKIIHYFNFSFSKLFSSSLKSSNKPKKFEQKINTVRFLIYLRYVFYFVDLLTVRVMILFFQFQYDYLILDRSYLDYKININYLAKKTKINLKPKKFIDFQFLLVSKNNTTIKVPKQGYEYFQIKNNIYKKVASSSELFILLNSDFSKSSNLKSVLTFINLEKDI